MLQKFGNPRFKILEIAELDTSAVSDSGRTNTVCNMNRPECEINMFK